MALKRQHEGTEMMTSDELLTRNYNSNKQKSAINSDISVLKKLDSNLHGIRTEEIVFYNKVKLSVRIDSLLVLRDNQLNHFVNMLHTDVHSIL